MLVDTHCHLDFPEFDQDRHEVIQRARDSGIGYIVNIGSSLSGSQKSYELAQKYDFIYASCGIHPHDADKADEKMQDALRLIAKKDKIVAIGETGLDYYKNYSKPESQMPLFVSLVKLAKELGLPLVIHSRAAQEDTLKVLKSLLPLKAVVHCFSADADFLKSCLDLGFFISFTCNLTYRKAENLRDLAKITPLERLMLETDAPFLSPEGLRGRRNEPLYVKNLAQEISRIKEISPEDVARVTTDNAKKFFNLR
jgi:TatD DNase family protein